MLVSCWEKTEIIKQLGCFPAFLIPNVDSSLVYRSLIQQTVFAYLNNPLPVRFKEKLFICLSRYFGIRYFTICHSCTLYSLGFSAAEILQLQKIEYSQTQAEIKAHLQTLSDRWEKEPSWQDDRRSEIISDCQIETSLLHCSNYIFLNPEHAVDFSTALKEVIGIVNYHYLIVLLGYIKLCHRWVTNNPQISHQQDRRSQLYLGSLLLEDERLVQFLQAEVRLQQDSVCINDREDRLNVAVAQYFTCTIERENKLVELETQLNLLLETTETGTFTWNLATNQVNLCDRGCRILKLKDFDGSYKSFLQSIHPSEREFIDLEAARAIQAHQDLDLKYYGNKIDGNSLIRIRGRLQYNAEGRPIRLTGIVSNITSSSLKRAKNASLKQQNTVQFSADLENIINLLPYYLFVIDIKSNTISAINSGLAQSLSLSISETKGKTLAECFAPKYAKQIAWQHQQVISYKQTLQIQEKVALPDGLHYFDTVITPLYDDRGEIHALLHTFSDLPDLAATQEALSQRTIQLEAANRELESFSYSVSHDLQAPLRVINGFSQVLWENYRPSIDDRGKHYLQRIQDNSKRMSDLIDALLELSRVTRSQMKSSRVNLSAIALDTIAELTAADSQRQVEVTIAPNLEAHGDPQLLRIALCNLFNNAWKYTSKRSLAKIEFDVLTSDEGSTIYYLRDNGAGFDSDYADKLFKAFQRLHNLEEFPGTGIGLATVQRIIFRHGGKVWAEGECDRGATIYFSL